MQKKQRGHLKTLNNYRQIQVLQQNSLVKRSTVQSVKSNKSKLLTIYNIGKLSIKLENSLTAQIAIYNSINNKNIATISKTVLIRSENAGVNFGVMRSDKSWVTLKQRLREGVQLKVVHIAKEMILALRAIHSSGLTHNNICLSTIMMSQHGLKLDLPYFSEIERCQRKKGDWIENARNNAYVSPEQWNGEGCSEASDIWALGIVLLQLALGKDLQNMGRQLRKESVLASLTCQISNILLRKTILNMLDQQGRRRVLHTDMESYSSANKYEISQRFTPVLQIILTHNNHQTRLPSKYKINPKTDTFSFELEIDEFFLKISRNEVSSIISFQFTSKKISDLKYCYFLKDDALNYNTSQYFQRVRDIFPFLVNAEPYQFSIDSSSKFIFSIPELQAQQRMRYLYNKNKINCQLSATISSSCMGFIFSDRVSNGFLISKNMVLTTASALYSREQKLRSKDINFVSMLSKEQNRGVACYYPLEYQTCLDQQKWKYDYGIVFLEQEILQKIYVTLIYDFSEQVIQKKLKQQISSDALFYNFLQKGIIPCDVVIDEGKAFLKDSFLFTQSGSGQPLFISFNTPGIGSIGMSVGDNQIVLYNKQMIENLHLWNQEYFNQHPRKYQEQNLYFSFRSFSSQSFIANKLVMKEYFSILHLIKGSKSMKILIIKMISEAQYCSAAKLCQMYGLFLNKSKEAIRWLICAKTIYEQIVDQQSLLVTEITLKIGEWYEMNNRWAEAIQNYEQAFLIEEKWQFNSLRLAKIYINLGSMLKKNGQIDQALAIWEMGIEYLSNCKINQMLGFLHQQVAQLLRQKGSIEEAEQHMLKAKKRGAIIMSESLALSHR